MHEFNAGSGVYPFTGLEYWTGILDWNTGLDYWTELFFFFEQVSVFISTFLQSLSTWLL